MLPTAPATPDWMKSLLPDGGKVSVTVHAAPGAASAGGASAPTVDPNTGVALQPGQAPAGAPAAVAAMRQIGAPNSAQTSQFNTLAGPANPVSTPGPAGPGAIPPGGLPPTGRTTTPTDPHASNSPDSWWNPYMGRFDRIPGLDATGKVIDANAFWNYYTKYPSAGLDKIANGISSGTDPNAWQHQYTDAEKQGMVTGNSDYITGLGQANQRRFTGLMNYGDLTPEQIAAFGLTPEQVKAIRENPNSIISQLRDALRSSTYEHAAGYAARGAYNSGARLNDIGNMQTSAVKQQAKAQFDLNAGLESENQAVQDLFKSVKDSMEAEGGFDPGDTEHNKAAWEATHKTVAAATKTFGDFLTHVSGWQKLNTVSDMRSALNDARKAYTQYGKLVSPADAGKLKAIIDGLTKKIHTTVMARSAKNARPVTGGGSAAGGGAYGPGKRPR